MNSKLESLKASLEVLPSPIMLVSSESDEIWMNAAFMRFIDREPGGVKSPDRIVTRQRRPFAVYQDGRLVTPDRLPSSLSASGKTVTSIPLQMHLQSGRIVDVLVFAGPVRDKSGRVEGGIVTCFDVSEQERRSIERLGFLADAGEALADAMNVGAVVSTLQRLLVPRIGGYCHILLLSQSGRPENVFLYHVDPKILRTVQHLRVECRLDASMFDMAVAVARRGEPMLVSDLHEVLHHEEYSEAYRRFIRALIDRIGVNVAMVVPMRLSSRTMGSIFVADRRHRRFTKDDLRLLEDLARRAAAALESARSLQRHEESSTTLQRALLPARLPDLEDVVFDAVYAPGGDEALVGGDWYDAFDLPDGRVMLTIGDVTGRGLHAAVLMSKVRQSLSALSYYETNPVKLLDVAQSTLQRRHPDAIVTAFVGVLDRRDLTFTYATAGHPMPYLRRGEAVIPLPAHGLPIGLRSEGDTWPVMMQLAPDDVLLLYTDGLVESTHDIVEGERRVVAALRSPHSGNIAHYVEHLVLPEGSPDDVALLAMRITNGRDKSDVQTLRFRFDARDARMARESRLCFTTFLRELGAPQERLATAELVYGELISNVVRHAPGTVYVSIDWTGEYPELRITDCGCGYAKHPGLPRDLLSETGRGLFIVEALTRRFEVSRAPHGGSDVRALLDVPRATAVAALAT
jgi:serine phosphatase RsbU (regulator of sigma subunit)/anti-sigma regulatory factor (Ser/Thr protein kinase)